MKSLIKNAVLALAVTMIATACTQSDIKGFKKTDDGLHYKFETRNSDGREIHVGDVIIGELVFKLDTMILNDNTGKPTRLLMVRDSVFNGYNIDRGILMMHEGEKATFAIYADSVARYFTPQQMPPTYRAGSNMIFYYEINITGVLTHDEYMEEQENYREAMEQRKATEPQVIASYVAQNFPNAKPNSEGLYIIVNKRGTGARVAMGKDIQVDYTGRLLDGRIFDTSREADAKEADIYNSQRPYEPLAYKVGTVGLIKGWEDGIKGLAEGSKVTLIIPSALGYGERGAGDMIEPYSPLRFDIEIVSVK